MRLDQRPDIKGTTPRSDVICSDSSNLEIHDVRNVFAHYSNNNNMYLASNIQCI